MRKNLILLVFAAFLAALTGCSKVVTGVQLDSTSVNLEVGETKTLIATVLPESAINKNVVWASNHPSVATVDQNGMVTALEKGVSTITATTEEGGFSEYCSVNVFSTPIVEELLTQENGWELGLWLCEPPIIMEGTLLYNIFNMLDKCYLDDIIYFKKDKTQVLNYGSNLFPGQTGTEVVLGNWELTDYGQSLYYYLLDSKERVPATIQLINESTLLLSIFFTYEEVAKMFPQLQGIATGMEKSNHEYKIIYRKID
jgi:hypothetical protein